MAQLLIYNNLGLLGYTYPKFSIHRYLDLGVFWVKVQNQIYCKDSAIIPMRIDESLLLRDCKRCESCCAIAKGK